MTYRNALYWTKEAMKEAPGDPNAARIFRFFTDKNALITPVVEGMKPPLRRMDLV